MLSWYSVPKKVSLGELCGKKMLKKQFAITVEDTIVGINSKYYQLIPNQIVWDEVNKIDGGEIKEYYNGRQFLCKKKLLDTGNGFIAWIIGENSYDGTIKAKMELLFLRQTCSNLMLGITQQWCISVRHMGESVYEWDKEKEFNPLRVYNEIENLHKRKSIPLERLLLASKPLERKLGEDFKFRMIYEMENSGGSNIFSLYMAATNIISRTETSLIKKVELLNFVRYHMGKIL